MATPKLDPQTGTYGRAYHEEQFDRLVHDLATEVEAWLSRDREASATHLASRITNIARAMSAQADGLARISAHEGQVS